VQVVPHDRLDSQADLQPSAGRDEVIADLCHVCEFPAEHSLICECGIRLCMFCRERHQELCTGRRTPDVEPDDSDHGVECDAFTPRPYQQEAYSNAMADLNGKSQSSLVVMPTGTGKTVLFGLIARDWPNGKVLVVAHREELIFQAADKIEQICGDRPDIEMADLRAGQNEIWTNSHVVITSVQTMSRERRQSRFKPEEFGLVIIDEAHHAVATTYKKVLDYFGQNPNLKILGVTATPDRADEEALGQVFESVAYDYQIPNAVHDGWLVPIDQQFVYVEGLDLSACKTTAGDLNSGDLARIMDQGCRADNRAGWRPPDACVRVVGCSRRSHGGNLQPAPRGFGSLPAWQHADRGSTPAPGAVQAGRVPVSMQLRIVP
jgi:hypothetical protein